MKRYTGKHLFPDPNQIYRIRKVVLDIQQELSERYDRHISFVEFASLLNEQLENKGWIDDMPVSESKLSRLSRFGKGNEGNNIKLLETLPLLHLVSVKYSEEDLQRIALGQPIAKDEGGVTLYPKEVSELKTRVISVLAYLDELTNTNARQVKDVGIEFNEKRFIFDQLVNYRNNFNLIKDMGILSMDEIGDYLESDVPDDVIVAMLALCDIPGSVRVMLAKKEPTLRVDPNVINRECNEPF